MGDLDNSATVEITGKIMVIGIIVLFLVVVFVLFLHLYAKWFWWRIEAPLPLPSPRRRRRRFVFIPGQDPVRSGLDLSVLNSLPVIIFNPVDFKDGLECAVCLSEIVEGEKARLLPKCNHGFHVDCIDMWFQSHSTCPLCRNSVAPLANHNHHLEQHHHDNVLQSPDQTLASGYSTESPNFPTNVLFWGDHTQVSTGGNGSGSGNVSACLDDGPSSSVSSSSSSVTRLQEMLVIDIPLQTSDNFSEEESKSPLPARLGSLKRLLSREKRVAPSPSSSSDDVPSNAMR